MNIDYVLQNHGIGVYRKKDKTPPPPCTEVSASVGINSQITLNWKNPIDSDYVGLKILRKEGSYPTSMIDGTLIYTGANISYTDISLTNGVTYYYRFFTFDWDNNYNETELGQEVTGTPGYFEIYGVKIDTLNTNPATALTYTDNAVGLTPALGNNGTFNAGSWEDKFPFNAIKPCLFLNGVVNYYLNPLDFTKKADGSASDITTGIDGDVMIEFPKVYWKFETIGTDVYIRYSSVKIDKGYKCLGHTKGIIEKDKCYISAYLGRILSSKHRSLSGYLPTATQSLTNFRVYAHATGAGIEVLSYFQYLMLQVLFIVMFKNRDSQSALGSGYTAENASSIATGGTNAKGMFYGSTSTLLQNKFCGIEDIFGNLQYALDGLFFDGNRDILIGTENYNNTGVGYINYGPYGTATINAWLGTIQGGTETGFIYKGATGASGTTHYCDAIYMGEATIPFVGGFYNNTANYNGIFEMYALVGPNSESASLGARIGFL